MTCPGIVTLGISGWNGEALTRQDLGLPVQREVVGVARHQDVGDSRLGRHAALNCPVVRPPWRPQR